jgi:flagellar biosynthesis/type III secretory pathway protein FliH
MKSSSKRFTASGAVTSWKPPEFSSPAAASDEPAISPDEILALFKGDLPVRPAAGLRGPSDLMPKSQVPCQAWNPTDLPPFDFQSSVEMGEKVHLPAKKEAVSAANAASAAVISRDMVSQQFEEAQAARSEAERILEAARAEAHELVQKAQEEAELRLQQAYEQGQAQAQAELAAANQAAQTVIQELETWRDSMLAQSEPVVISMVQEIAQALFGDGMVVETKVLQEFLSKSLTRARNMGNLRIFLNPADAGHIEPDWREYQTALTGQRMQIIPTNNIKPGGCYIEAELGSVDARIDTRMEAVMSVFNQSQA